MFLVSCGCSVAEGMFYFTCELSRDCTMQGQDQCFWSQTDIHLDPSSVILCCEGGNSSKAGVMMPKVVTEKINPQKLRVLPQDT